MRTQLAVALREMAKHAGIDINVQTMPHATYLDQVWKKGSFYVGFYNMQPTPDGIFKLLYTSNAAWNETRWNNKAFDALIDEARGVSSTRQAHRALHQGAGADERRGALDHPGLLRPARRPSATGCDGYRAIRARRSSGSISSRWTRSAEPRLTLLQPGPSGGRARRQAIQQETAIVRELHPQAHRC